jgi:glycosyltransferase involved in cell wall biosynthesis
VTGSEAPAVTVLLPDLTGGGAERVMLTVAGGLAAHGARVRLVLGSGHGPLAALVPGSVRVDDLGVRHVRQAVPRLARHLRRDRPHVLLSTLEHTNVAALLAGVAAGGRTAVTVRVANTMSSAAAGPKDRLALLAARALYPRARRVVAPSRGVADDVVATVGPRVRAALRVIPNPVVGPDVAARAAVAPAHPWFAAGAPPVVLAVGSLTPKKNQRLLLEAFAQVRAAEPARLVVLGEGPSRAELERTAHRLGVAADVTFAGWVDDPYPYLARCAVFVLSSDREGLPGALVQALACGARVVATDCASGPAEILDGGRLGRLVPVGDAAALARAVSATLAEHAAAAPRPDPASALARYTEDAAIDAYVGLVEELVSEGRQ